MNRSMGAGRLSATLRMVGSAFLAIARGHEILPLEVTPLWDSSAHDGCVRPSLFCRPQLRHEGWLLFFQSDGMRNPPPCRYSAVSWCPTTYARGLGLPPHTLRGEQS